MATAEAWAAANGYDELRLCSNIVREEAHCFYERLGYEQVKTSKVFRKALRSSTVGAAEWKVMSPLDYSVFV